MEAALKKRSTGWKDIRKDCEAPRTDATFTEIYELIYQNQTMVRSELGVLLQLIQKKAHGEGRSDPCLHGQ